jgi:hypothetical protein
MRPSHELSEVRSSLSRPEGTAADGLLNRCLRAEASACFLQLGAEVTCDLQRPEGEIPRHLITLNSVAGAEIGGGRVPCE